jgi:hypothetical protein
LRRNFSDRTGWTNSACRDDKIEETGRMGVDRPRARKPVASVR